MIGSNYSEELRPRVFARRRDAQGVGFNLGVGGPMCRNRFWYFGTFRDEAASAPSPGCSRTPMRRCTKDLRGRHLPPAVNAASYRMMPCADAAGDAAQQARAFWDEQKPCEGGAAPGTRSAPAGRRATARSSAARPRRRRLPLRDGGSGNAAYRYPGNRITRPLTSPATNRLLLEAGMGSYRSARVGSRSAFRSDGFHSRHRTVRRRLCGERKHPNLVYRSANWSSNINWNSQCNGRCRSHGSHRSRSAIRVRCSTTIGRTTRTPSSGVPRQQRHPQPLTMSITSPVGSASGRRVLRAGSVDLGR